MAIKHDQGKLRMDLIPTAAERAIARALTDGSVKYGDYNYTEGEGLTYSRLYGAARRHLADWWDGNEPDKDSGLSHLDHALACLAMIADLESDKGQYGHLDNRRRRKAKQCTPSAKRTGRGRNRQVKRSQRHSS